MSRLPQTGMKFKIFVKEQNGGDVTQEINRTKYFTVSPLSGDKAKEFYEHVLKESSASSNALNEPEPKPNPKSKPKAQRKRQFRSTDLLVLAQNNDVDNLEKFFSQNKDYDVNIVDDFGWTPLMCACCSGAESAVGILLDNGADPTKCDTLGNTAMKLAKQKNYRKIVEMLEDYNTEVEPCERVEESNEPFFCQTCKENFTMNRSKHESSTLHLFNCKIKTSTFYGIPESNRGFQLLLKKGWDKEKGLGRDGTGRKFPVKAKMKKDKLGIGAQPPESTRQAPHTQKYESKRRKIYSKWKEKEFEKNFRLEFT